MLLPSAPAPPTPRERAERAVRVARARRRRPGRSAALAAPRARRSPSGPATGETLSARGNPAARDLIRHALADLPRNGNRARAWAKAARRWPAGAAARTCSTPTATSTARRCCCGPTRTRRTRSRSPRSALDLLPDAQLRVLPGTGFLMAYDDPVGLAREIAAFCL